MKIAIRFGIFLLLLLGFNSVGHAVGASVSWGGTMQATYNTAIPGEPLIDDAPLSRGGMNLTTASMTTGTGADIAFDSDAKYVGASGIMDLGEVDFNSVSEIPGNGYAKVVRTNLNHTYIVKLASGSFAKLKITLNVGSSVKFSYAIQESTQDLPDGAQVTYDLSIPGNPLTTTDPTYYGGLDFSTGEMTTDGKLADIAISSRFIGARAIYDLGMVDLNEVNYSSIPDNIPPKITNLYDHHVYVAYTHDDEFVKFYVIGVFGSTVDLVYQVMQQEQELVSIQLNGPDSIGLSPVTLSVKGTYSDDSTDTIPNSEVTWSTSDASVGKITEDGVFQLTGKTGQVTITATYQGLEDSITYKISPTLLSLKINQTLKYSPTPVTLTVSGTYSDKTTKSVTSGINWKSNNTKIAIVSSKGVVNFTGNSGTVTITATYAGKTAAATCTVGNVVKSLSTTTKLAYSKTPMTVALYATYSNGKKVKVTNGAIWKSSNTNVAKVSSSGVVTFTGQNGDVTITATYQGRTLDLKVKVFLKENTIKFFTSSVWMLYNEDFGSLYVGKLLLLPDGTYIWNRWDNIKYTKYTGKWKLNGDNATLTLYDFGPDSKDYTMSRIGNKIDMLRAPWEEDYKVHHYVGK